MKGQSSKNDMQRASSGTIFTTGALDDLSVFLQVAQQASFVAAARRMGIPASNVSRAVFRLEELVGTQLLRRTSRRVALTDEGRQLQLHAAVHLEGLEEALLSAADRHTEPSGIVRVTAPAYTGSTRVARALASFARAHPQITIELDATNSLRDLVAEGFDFGIRIGPYSTSPDFVTRKLWQGAFGLFATRSFVKRKLGGRVSVTRDDLERVPAITLRRDSKWRFQTRTGASVEISPATKFAVNDPRGAVDVARQGLGLVLAPLDAVAGVREELVALQTDFGEPEPIDLYVVYPTRRLLPRRVRLAIDHLAGATTARK